MSAPPTPAKIIPRRYSRVCGLVAVVIGAEVLLGWVLGVGAMTSIVAGLLTVKANSAIAMILLGCALALLVPEDAGRTSKGIAVAFALVGLAWGLLTFLETVAVVNLHIDQLLFKEAAHAAWTASPGRPPATASLCFVLVSTGLLALRVRRTTAMQLLAGGVSVVTAASLLTFILGASQTRAFGDYYTTMPVLSSAALLVLAIGLLSARPHEGPMAVFTAQGVGGRTTRRLAVFVVAIPTMIALLAREGQTLALFSPEYGLVLQVTTTMVLLMAVVWLLAKWLDRGEQALLDSEALLRGILDNMQDVYVRADAEGRLVMVSPSAARMYGYESPDELIGLPTSELYLHDADRETMLEEMRLRGRVADRVGEGRRKDGSGFWVSMNAQPWLDARGRVMGLEGFVRDISERRTADAALAESEERYRGLFSTMLEGFAYCRMEFDEAGAPNDFVYLKVNPAFETLTGLGDVVGKRVTEVIPDIRGLTPDVFETYGRVVTTGEPANFEIDFKPLDKWLTVSATRPHEGHFVAMFHDISERKLAEAALRDSEGRYRELANHLSSGVVVYEATADGRDFVIRDFNHAAEAIEKIERADVVGRVVTQAFPGIEAFGLLDVLRRVHQTGVSEAFPMKLYADERLSSWRENFIYRLPSGEVVAVYDDVTERVVADLALRESEDKFRHVFDSSLVGLSMTLPSGEIAINEAFCRILGYSSAEIQGQTWQALTYPDDIAATEKVMTAILAGERESARIEKRYVHRDGSIVWADVATTLRRDANGQPLHFITSVLDITERKRAEEALRASEERLRRFYESPLVGVIYWNMDGQLTDANDRFLEMVGYSREELGAGAIDWKVMTPPEFAHVDERSVAELKETGVNAKPFEKAYLRKDGTRLPIMVGGAMLDDERFDGVAIVIDITERKLAEEQLQQAEEALRRERDELERSNAELEQFAYVASHDLQEPLRMVSMYTELLARRYEGRLDDDADEFIGYAVDGAKRMQALIIALLEFSRVGSRGSTFVATDSRTAFDEAVANLGHAIADAGAVITCDGLPTVTGDHEQLVRVFQNLIGNAVKFRGEEPPCVHVSAERENGDWVFSVRDNGIGMESQYFDRVFLIFQRLHSKEDYPGTGIGLALCQRIVARHGGRMWVRSATGEGATFFFTIPVGDESP